MTRAGLLDIVALAFEPVPVIWTLSRLAVLAVLIVVRMHKEFSESGENSVRSRTPLLSTSIGFLFLFWIC